MALLMIMTVRHYRQKPQLSLRCRLSCESARDVASVGLRVSVSYDLGEIVYNIVCNLIMLFVNILFIII